MEQLSVIPLKVGTEAWRIHHLPVPVYCNSEIASEKLTGTNLGTPAGTG